MPCRRPRRRDKHHPAVSICLKRGDDGEGHLFLSSPLSALRLSKHIAASRTRRYDGSRVFALPRAKRALTKHMNVVDLGRMSQTYEVRLAKYAKRGFAVAIPGEGCGNGAAVSSPAAPLFGLDYARIRWSSPAAGRQYASSIHLPVFPCRLLSRLRQLRHLQAAPQERLWPREAARDRNDGHDEEAAVLRD